MFTPTPSGSSAGHDILVRAIELKDSNDYKDRLVAITAFAFQSGARLSRTAEIHLKDLTSDPVPAVAEFAAEALKRCDLMP